jgi:release factor glutamine methyltransferase
MLLKDMISHGRGLLSAVYPEGETSEIVFAYLEDVFGIRRYEHLLNPDQTLPEPETNLVMIDFARMASGEPLQYVTGKAHFYGRQFKVTPDVLIPRQETEMLCHTVLSTSRRNQNILDLCTGSGCIAWTLALEMPGSKVTAVDISDGALSVASSQDFIEEMDRTHAFKPCFIKADVLKGPAVCANFFSDYATLSPKFDIIVSNPPYVMDSEKPLMRTNVLDHEPHLALFVPDDDALKFYVAVAQWAAKLLAEDGIGVVEINEALGKETARVFIDAGFSQVEIVKDLHDKDRFVRFSR